MTTNRSGNPNGTTAGAGVERTIDHLKERVRGVVDQGHERVDHLKHRMMDAKDQAVTRGNDMLERVTEFIRANPLKAVGIAFGVGYLGMRLFRR